MVEMVALYQRNPGDEILAADVNQFVKLLSGLSGVEHPVQLTRVDSATAPTLTLKNLNATSGAPVLVAKDSDANDTFTIRRLTSTNPGDSIDFQQVLLHNGGRLMINNTGNNAMSKVNYFALSITDAEPTTVAELLYFTSNALVGDTPDVATTAIIGDQGVGDGYFRTVEIDMLARSGTTALPKLGIELSIEAKHAGNGSDNTVGIAIHNYSDLWFGGSSVAIDTAILIGRDDAPFTNFIRCMGNTDDGNANTVLFNIDQDGTVNTKNIIPLTDSLHTIGDVSNNYYSSWVDTYVSTQGIGTGVHFSLGATNTGMGLPASNAIGFYNNAVENIRIGANGLLDFRNPSGIHIIAAGGGAAATLTTIGGSGPGTAAQNNWLKLESNGTTIFIPIWV